MRISNWARQFGVQVTPVDAVSQPPNGAKVWRVKDIFTTRDGSWDVSNQPGSIEQWARDEYLWREFDDAGADHHLFGHADGISIRFWTWTDNGNQTTQQAKLQSGWANIPLYASSSFVPERGERGPWAWQPNVPYADVVTGGGLPARQHVSWFVVWRAETYNGGIVTEPEKPTEPPVEPPISDLAARVARLEADMAEFKRLLATWVGD